MLVCEPDPLPPDANQVVGIRNYDLAETVLGD